jgi:hypothetical protein
LQGRELQEAVPGTAPSRNYADGKDARKKWRQDLQDKQDGPPIQIAITKWWFLVFPARPVFFIL